MNDESAKKLKAEILRELSEIIKNQVEDKVEEEVDEELRKHTRHASAMRLFKGYFIAVVATIIALGQFSEAFTLLGDGVNLARTRLTNTVEYDLLSNVHVSNTESYIESLMGNPQISRAINEQVVANYYYNRKFLLTVFIGDQRVVAYTIIPLKEDFKPVILDEDGMEWTLGETNYASFPANPKLYVVDHSKTISYYLESLDTGRAGLFVQNYLGNVSLGPSARNELIIDLYDEEVNGSEEAVLETQTRLREQSRPNLFGMGVFGVDLIQKSILTGAEFTSYFGQ